MNSTASRRFPIFAFRPLAAGSLALLAGVFLARYQGVFALWPLAAAILLGGAVAVRKHRRTALCLLCVVALLFGWARGTSGFALRSVDHQRGEMMGTVYAVEQQTDKRSQVLLRRVTLDGKALGDDVVATVFDVTPKIGERMRATARPMPVRNSSRSSFDARLWRLSQGVGYEATMEDYQSLGMDASPLSWPLLASKAMKAQLVTLYGDQAPLVIGMTLGGTDAMSDDQIEVFRIAGISHVLAVSGLHVGFLMAAVNALGKRIKDRRTLVFLLSLSLLWAYALLVGLPASAVRACLMASVVLLARYLGWQYDLLTALCLSAALIVLVRPAQLFAAGFILSFTAMAGIACLATPLAAFCQQRLRFPTSLASTVGTWLAAQAGLLPFSVWLFGTVSLVSLMGNLLIVPLASLVTLGGLISGLLSFLWVGLGMAPAALVYGLVAAMDGIARLIAAVPGALITVTGLLPSQIVLWCGALATLSRYCLMDKRVRYGLAMGFVALFAVWPFSF